MIVSEAAVDHELEPPPTDGTVGAVWSSMTVLWSSTADQAELLPAASTARNCTSVEPSALIGAEAPSAGCDQWRRRRWRSRTGTGDAAEPSVEPDADTFTEAALCQALEPPVTAGTLGALRSIATWACEMGLTLPTPSTASNCTSVWPSSVTGTSVSGAHDDQLVPASVEVRNW